MSTIRQFERVRVSPIEKCSTKPDETEAELNLMDRDHGSCLPPKGVFRDRRGRRPHLREVGRRFALPLLALVLSTLFGGGGSLAWEEGRESLGGEEGQESLGGEEGQESLGGEEGQESLGGEEGQDPSWTVVREAPGQGEQCLVCRKTLTSDVNAITLRYRGREFAVGEPFYSTFEENPEKYFAKLQPRGALFDEADSAPRPLGDLWLYSGLYILVGLVAGGACSYLSIQKGRGALPWFFAGLIGNVVALGAIFAASTREDQRAPEGVPKGLRKVPLTHSPVSCPRCGSSNHPSATVCSSCRGELRARVDGEVSRA